LFFRTGYLAAGDMLAILKPLMTYHVALLATDPGHELCSQSFRRNVLEIQRLFDLQQKRVMDEKGFPLMQLMARYLRHRATDSRDLVYALTSFASDCTEGDVPIDYDATMEATFLAAIVHHMKKHRNLKFIQHVCYSPRTKVDWANAAFSPATWAHSWAEYVIRDEFYEAHGINRASDRLTCLPNAVSPPSLTISAQGFCIDHVVQLPGGPQLFPSPTLSQHWASLLDIFPDIGNLDQPECDDISDAILWTLTAGGPERTLTRKACLAALRILHQMACSSELNVRTIENIRLFWRDFWPEPVDESTADAFNSLTRSIGFLDFYTLRTGLPACSVWNSHRPGDQIWIIFGCDLPMILRPAGRDFTLIQSAFVHGFMKGEAVGGLDVRTPFATGDVCNGRVVEEIRIL
jgi:hypothetical protein